MVMEMHRSRRKAPFILALIAGIALACSASGIHEDELDCEDAVGHLQQCCPGFTGQNIYCIHDAVNGCLADGDDYAQVPDFTVAQSDCLRSESCSDLQSSGVCERVSAIVPNGGEQTGYQAQASTSPYSVCP
jgi:hypothetical protein